jgi:hypothetical protein
MRKIHLHKQEENVIERGIQIRSIAPDQPIEDQLWVDLEDKTINLYKNDTKITIGSDGVSSAEQIFVLSEQDIERKYLILQKKPINGSIVFTPDGGIPQRKDIDYRLTSESKVEWNGLCLDGFLEEGEVIQINYLFISN